MDNNKSVITAIVAVVIVIAAGLGIWAVTQNDDDNDTAQTQQVEEQVQEEAVASQNIVELAVSVPELSTLVTAVEAAGLVDTLSGPGPFTVLAPTNDAFAALPEGVLDNLLLPENVEDLQNVLTYHVVAAEVFSSDLSNGQVVETVNGGSLTVEISDTGVFFVDANGGRAQVITPDVDASNGVVHVIDAVLLP